MKKMMKWFTKDRILKILDIVLVVLVAIIGIRAVKLEEQNKNLLEQQELLNQEILTLTNNNQQLITNNERFQMMADESYNLFLSCVGQKIEEDMGYIPEDDNSIHSCR